MFLSKSLKYYKKPRVKEAIANAAVDREISVLFDCKFFGKRPDVINYPEDVMALALKKASSFHCSEERWYSPLQIKTGQTRREADELRKGWDLVLDVDCPHWYFSKLTTRLFIDALKANGINSITVKFSGNKGFHIGVPFESFPETINGIETKNLFPEAPRAIAKYILEFVEKELIKVRDGVIDFGGYYQVTLEELKKLIKTFNKDYGKDMSTEFIVKKCSSCGTKKEEQEKTINNYYTYFCTSCGHSEKKRVEKDFIKCPSCGSIADLQKNFKEEKCNNCGSKDFLQTFNVEAIIEVDTILLASRHLFRMPYSLHEKSGLVSVVIPLDKVMSFEKEQAKPELVKEFPVFLNTEGIKYGEGTSILSKALAIQAEKEAKKAYDFSKKYQVPEEAIPEDCFPPTIQKMRRGLRDGRKRALFALTNFFICCGWGKEQTEYELYAWNKRNEEPLREVYIKGQLRYAFLKKEAIMPPNYQTRFYKDLGVYETDDFESSKNIKNPVQYAKKKFELLYGRKIGEDPTTKKKPGRKKLTDEQKEMRRAYKEKLKKEKIKK